jgi:SAM-dependent methyltransferase
VGAVQLPAQEQGAGLDERHFWLDPDFRINTFKGSNMKNFLHVGCGSQTKAGLKGFNSEEWNEIRFDIDEKVKPDIIGTLTDMRAVPSESMDAVFSSHNIEHVFPHEVPMVLSEFHRVLKPEGFVVITCPDLVSVCSAVAQGNLMEPLYVSPAGPISAIDILYGHRGYIANGNEYMAHKGGFTYQSLMHGFFEARFGNCFGGAVPEAYALWLVAFKNIAQEDVLKQTAATFLPN